MKKFKSGFISILTAAGIMLTPLAGMPASAREQNAAEYLSSVDTSKLPNSKELEKLFIERLFRDCGTSLYKADYGASQLTGAQLEMYNTLKAHISAIANGEKTNTVLELTRTAEFTGTTQSEFDAVFEAEGGKFTNDVSTAFDYLMVDMPMEFYWFNKTQGGGMQQKVEGRAEGNTITLSMNITFAVSRDYMDADDTTVNTEKIGAAKSAAAYAREIAAKYDGKSDYDKILGYKEEICNLVSYNHDAADDSKNTPYGDPWQLVWVFDGDPDTNVVCEGYSKAFQYLCDMGGVECYIVTGKMNGGAHMWNIAVLDGKSYHVDVTNCDEGTVGAPGKLLLKGASASTAGSCSINGITYTYDTDLVYPADILTVSTEDYTPTEEPSYSLNPTTATLTSGEEKEFKAVGVAEDEYDLLKWELDVSDPLIAALTDNRGGTCTVTGGTAAGTGKLTASLDGKKIGEATITVTAAAGDDCRHILTARAAVAPSCTNGGNEAYWTCSECGKMFSDAAGITEIADVPKTPALGHDIAPLFIQDERSHYQKCVRCNIKIGEQLHSEDGGTVTVAPGDTTDGVRSYKCTVCGRELRTETIPALGESHVHNYTITNFDINHHWKECICGNKDEFSPHTNDTREKIVLEATCSADGLKYVIGFCKVCGAETSRQSDFIPKTNVHTPGSEYGMDADSHWKICTGCDKRLDLSTHISDGGKVTTPATESAEGVKTYSCTVCEYVIKTEAIPKSDHIHKPADAWSTDETGHWHGCANCAERLDFNAHISDGGKVTTPATETAEGVKTYSCTVCGYVIKTETIPKSDHTHNPADAWSADETGHWHICANCAEKLDFHAHKSDSGVVTTPATETSVGIKTYSCTVCAYVIKTEEIPKLSHTHSPAEIWSSDSAGHWHDCTVCGDRLGYGEHSFTDGICTVCGRTDTIDPKVTVILDPASAALHAGDTLTITAAALKNGAELTDAVFTWSTDKEKVIKVNNRGEAVAVGIGTATVTAEYNGIKASCAVTVEPRPVLTLTPTSLQLRKDTTSTLKLKVTVGGKTVNDPSVEWSSDNTDVATVSNGIVTAVKAGKAAITAEYDGVRAVCSVTVKTSGTTSAVRPSRPNRVTDYDTTDTANTTDNSDSYGKAKLNGTVRSWNDIANEIANGSGSCKIELNGEKEIPAEVIRAISESARTVQAVFDTSITLEINGAEVNSTLPVAFEKTELSPENIRGTNGLGFSYAGAANTGISATFKQGNAGRFANMYLKSGNSFSFASNAKISSDGSVKLTIPSVGVYVIMLSEFSDLKGDADNNGALNALDAALILKNSAEGIKTRNLAAADYDGNGVCNALDAALILKQITR